ncbi:MAG: TIM barrel protein, partial [Bacteroidota bacterium]
MKHSISRKDALKQLTLGAAAITVGSTLSACNPTESQASGKDQTAPTLKDLKGNVNHSACRWCYNDIPLEELCDASKDMGLKAIDLLNPDEWDIAIDRGLEVSMSFGSSLGIPKGFNDPQYHAQLFQDYEALIPQAAAKGLKRIICFSGNRNGLNDEAGLENCAVGLEPVVKLAQKYNVQIVMELLNSKVNHPDYQCDTTPWGVQLVEKVGSDHFKLLYDIYH